jgi:hypothetical protein
MEFYFLDFCRFLSFYLVIDGRGGRANSLLCRGVTGEVPAVGVTGPPDFLVKRLLKKLANAPSFAAALLPPGVTVLT